MGIFKKLIDAEAEPLNIKNILNPSQDEFLSILNKGTEVYIYCGDTKHYGKYECCEWINGMFWIELTTLRGKLYIKLSDVKCIETLDD